MTRLVSDVRLRIRIIRELRLTEYIDEVKDACALSVLSRRGTRGLLSTVNV